MLVKSQVKYIQSLGQKKFRDEESVFVAEGPKIINELLNAQNTTAVNIFAEREWIETNQSLIKKLKTPPLEIKESELERISFLTTPNEVLGIFAKPVFQPGDFKNKISLILDNIQDPGNMGTIIRTADWFGVRNIVCSNSSADVFNPKVIQSAMGSISRVQVLYKDIKAFLIEHADTPMYATTLHGNNITEIKPIEEGMIVIGNESKGISEELLQLIKYKITIPGKGKAESLNAAVSTGIVLWCLSS
jgi:TrmH family RNA methyltransferase